MHQLLQAYYKLIKGNKLSKFRYLEFYIHSVVNGMMWCFAVALLCRCVTNSSCAIYFMSLVNWRDIHPSIWFSMSTTEKLLFAKFSERYNISSRQISPSSLETASGNFAMNRQRNSEANKCCVSSKQTNKSTYLLVGRVHEKFIPPDMCLQMSFETASSTDIVAKKVHSKVQRCKKGTK